MLNKEAYDNIEIIKAVAFNVWGDKCKFGVVKVLEMPFPMFELHMAVYDSFDILFTYDRSILGINIKNNQGYKNIRQFTKKEIKGGFESCNPQNLMYNFKILDEILRNMKQSYN